MQNLPTQPQEQPCLPYKPIARRSPKLHTLLIKRFLAGWCVAEERGKIGQGYHFVKANSVGPAEDKNYNCIGKKYGDNSACCLDDFIPDPKDLTPLDDNLSPLKY
ncbi:hypothetical protein H4Q26_017054 [Puccinia striiformis f. sp. tritici PST-130]|nr:hypothetical protein H4Q26_017054 [Puccinia striiformis f. sp. tritici PST-130]